MQTEYHSVEVDIGNYCHDMMMLCGRVVLHNPDGAMDQEAKKLRDKKTRTELVKKFGSKNVDREVWGFPSKSATETSRSNKDAPDDELEIVVEVPCAGGRRQL